PNPDPSRPGDPLDNAGKPDPKPPVKKRRWVRWIVYAVLILIVGLIILIALTPMILSSGAGRNFVVGKINQNINGHVEIADWKVGWTGGIHADNVKVFDESGKPILQIPTFSTELSLLGVMRGKFHLGNTVVKGLDFFAERYPDGTLNFDRLAKTSKSAPREPEKPATTEKPSTTEQPKPAEKPATPQKKEPSKLPTIDGELHLVDCHGTFQNDIDDHTHKTVVFSTISGDVKIPSINGTIEDSLKIIADIDGHELFNLNTGGKAVIASGDVLLTPDRMNLQ